MVKAEGIIKAFLKRWHLSKSVKGRSVLPFTSRGTSMSFPLLICNRNNKTDFTGLLGGSGKMYVQYTTCANSIFPSIFPRSLKKVFLKKFMDERERERERDNDLLFYLSMHSLADSHRCPDWGWNPKPWHVRTMV